MIQTVASQPVPFQSASLYVGDLHPDITEGVLFELFNRVGPVASIRICRDTITKRSLGYGYVNFHNVQDAERAIDTMNFSEIKDRPCRIMWSQRDPHLRKSGVGNIFVKNLPPSVDNKALFDLFSVFGNILSCKVAQIDDGQSKGYGYIHYETAEAANDAIQKFNGNSIDDHVVQVVAFVRKQDRSNQTQWTNLYVKQFPKSWNEEALKNLFAKFGEIQSVAIMKDAEGNSKGFGFVNFTEHEDAAAAVLNLNKTPVEENGLSLTLYVGRAQKKIERQRELVSLHMQKREEKLNMYQGRNLYVKNVDDEVTDEEFLKLFSEHGTVANAKIMRESNGTSKGFGFVCYNTAEDALKAISALNGFRVKSKPIMVTLHQAKSVRMAHLAATFGNRMRGGAGGMPVPGGMPGAFPQGMAPMPYMYMQQGGAPGGVPPGAFPPGSQQRPGFYPNGAAGEPFPRGRLPGQGQQGMPQQQMRGVGAPYYPMPPYAMQQTPMGGQVMQSQMKQPRMGGPQQQQMMGRGFPGRGPRPGPAMPGRGPAGFPQPGRGPATLKFTNQVRNQQPMHHAVPVPMEMGQQVPVPAPAMNMAEPLDHTVLAEVDLQTQKNMIGERLYPLVYQHEPQRSGKITGMLLEMEITELLNLLESPDALLNKVREAVMVLETHERGVAEAHNQ